MKCIYCNTDTKYSDRRSNGGQCRSCRHPFAFEPKTIRPMVTDGLFQRAVKDVSGDGKLVFTERHIWYEFNRRVMRKMVSVSPGGVVAVLCAGGGLITAVVVASFWPVVLGAGGVAAGVVLHRRGRAAGPAPRRPLVPFDRFHSQFLTRWIQVHGPLEKLLPQPVPQPPPLAMDLAPEVTAYSFDRALVTDRRETAAMLVANRFHFENNCAILSADGYPETIGPAVMAMLHRNPQLKVFVLHNASVQGCTLAHFLRAPEWFPDRSVPVIDLGLRPRHARQMRLLVVDGAGRALPAGSLPGLDPAELAWLAQGHTAELECLRPVKLMRAVYQGFARTAQAAADLSRSGGMDGGTVWMYDGGADVSAADSFG